MSLKSFIKGKFGEIVISVVNAITLSNEYKRLNNITLRLEDGSTTQIDHILVSPYGIFVIETKNYAGWIFGSEHQKQWVQSLYGKKSYFQNPLHQNYRHIKAIESLLNAEPNVIHSVIMFSGETEFKTEMPKNVHRGTRYLDYIRGFTARTFTDNRVNYYFEKIQNGALSKSFATDREHVQSTKVRIEGKMTTCPKCGSELVIRNGKNGQFLGCKSYPKCRHTMHLN